MPLSSFHNRDMDKEPFTVGEFVKYLSEYPPDHELRFVGFNDQLYFHRFKYRGDKLLTIEFDDPGTMKEMGIV